MRFTFEDQLVVYFGYLLIFTSVFLVARMLLKEEESRAAQDSLDDLKNRKASNPLVRWMRPFFSNYVVPVIRGKKFWDKHRTTFKRKIITAGLKDELTPDEFIGFKVVLIVFFPLAGGMLKAGGVIDLSNWFILATGIAGYFYPNLWVKSRIDQRQREIRRSMPFIVDLLALSTEAGLDFIGAIAKVVEKSNPSPLVDEFEQVLREIKVGSSRQDALREMAIRVDMPEIGSFVAILISADQMGASIGKILRQQSEQVRNQRFLTAERMGAAATQKLYFPIFATILPSILIMIFAPIVVGFLSGGAR